MDVDVGEYVLDRPAGDDKGLGERYDHRVIVGRTKHPGPRRRLHYLGARRGVRVGDAETGNAQRGGTAVHGLGLSSVVIPKTRRDDVRSSTMGTTARWRLSTMYRSRACSSRNCTCRP